MGRLFAKQTVTFVPEMADNIVFLKYIRPHVLPHFDFRSTFSSHLCCLGFYVPLPIFMGGRVLYRV